MSMQYVRETYGVPAKRGMRVEVYMRRSDGSWQYAGGGVIASASHYIHVRPDGANAAMPFHPTHGVVYFDKNGTVLHDSRE